MANYRIGILFLLAILAMCCVSYLMGRDKGYKEGSGQIQIDTLIQVDTLLIDHPVEVERIVQKVVYLPVKDTQIIHTTDSVYVALEREAKRYSDDNYECVVSGIQPSLDWIRVFQKTITITETKEPPKWSFGVTAGPSVVYNGKVHAGMGVTIGLNYRF